MGNPYAWLLVITGLVSLVGIPFVWHRRAAPGARFFILLVIGISMWSFGYAFELFSSRQEGMLFWTKIEYIGIVTVINSFLLVALEYSGRSHWINRRTLGLMLIHPIVVVVLAITNELHGLILKKVEVVEFQSYYLLNVQEHGAAFWFHSVYSYLALLIGTALLIYAVRRAPRLYQGQVAFILIAVITPWLSNAIYLLGNLPLDPTPLSFAVSAASLALSLGRYQLFGVVPVARDWLIDHMDDAVIVLDLQGRLIDVNQEVWNLLRYQSGQTVSRNLAGKSWVALFATWREQLEPFFSGGEERSEVNLGTATMPHWYEVRALPIHGSDEQIDLHMQPAGRLVIFHDINSRKQSEEMMSEARDQALQASLLKSQLVANVSHELRTPLNAILGFSEMLLEGGFGPITDRQAEPVQHIFQAARQMDLFVTDLLDQALIEKGKLTLNVSDFQTIDLLNDVRSMLGRSAQEKGIELRFVIDSNLPPTLRGDVKRLQQVLVNLVNNAIKYTDQGEICVVILRKGTSWAIEVKDTGIGIPSEAKGYIFEPFRQVEGRDGRKRGGAGLGLSIVRYLVTMMGGYVDLESEIGKGSLFRVVLPIEQQREGE